MSGRYHELDAARALAMIFVVAGHAAIAFMVTPIGWAIQNDTGHLGVDAFVWIVRAFVMPLFFWLSGFFSRAIYERGFLAGFVRHRVTRVALPLALAIVPCSLALDALWDWGRALAGRPEVAAHVPALEGSSLPLTLGHLWYLYYLLVISAAAIVIVPILRRLRIAARATFVDAPIVTGVVLVPLFVERALQLDTPLGFGIDPGFALFHGAFFAWGWMTQAHRFDLEQFAKRAWSCVAGALLLLVVIIPVLRDGGAPPVHAILASGLFTIVMISAFVGLCVRHLARPRPLLRLAAEASYWIYIVHLPLVVLLQLACSRLDLPWPLELAAIIAVTMTACVVSYLPWQAARGYVAARHRSPGPPARARSADPR